MSKQANFIRNCVRGGSALTFTVTTGDACPCMSWHGIGYSKDWHRTGNPGEDVPDCNGTGLLNRVETNKTIKGFIASEIMLGERNIPESIKAEIGNIDSEHILFYGQVDTSNNSFYSLKDFEERETVFIYSGDTYKVRKVFPLGEVAELTLLVKRG